jgi:Poly-adenylate binding protein, unique domain
MASGGQATLNSAAPNQLASGQQNFPNYLSVGGSGLSQQSSAMLQAPAMPTSGASGAPQGPPMTMVMMPSGGPNPTYTLQRMTPALPDSSNPDSVAFFNAMQALFKAEDFKQTATNPKARREQIGNAIYESVEKIIGSEAAPKITGMIIDLSDLELVPAVSTLENLTTKVKDAHTLLLQLQRAAAANSSSQESGGAAAGAISGGVAVAKAK